MIRAAIQTAEDLGYASVWFGDHLVVPDYATGLLPPHWFDPISCMLVGAGMTSRVRLGSDILVVPYRNPIALSQLLAGADQLSGGRLIVAAGVGYVAGEFEALGLPLDQRGKLTDEYLEVLRQLWYGPQPVSFAGHWINFDRVHALPRPLQDPFPLWVGGNGRAALRRAARLGSGWHPLLPAPEEYARSREHILQDRASQGISGRFDFSASSLLVRLLDSPGETVTFNGYSGRRDTPRDFHYAPAPPTDSDGRFRLVGTPDVVAEDIRAYQQAGVEHLVLRFAPPGDPEGHGEVGLRGMGVLSYEAALETFAREVASSFVPSLTTPETVTQSRRPFARPKEMT